MIVSLAIEASVRCSFCDVRNPLPGLRSTLDCCSCGRPIDVATIQRATRTAGVRYHFGGHFDVLAEATLLLKEGEGSRNNDKQTNEDNRLVMHRRAPACPSCNGPIGFDPHTQGDGLVPCPNCQERVAIRAPDPETREWDPRVGCIIGDARRFQNPMAQGPQGPVFQCSQCGTPLVPQGERRACRCGRCGNVNFLGDGAWRRLCPTPSRVVFFLVYDIDEARVTELRRALASDDRDSIAAHYLLERPLRERFAAELRGKGLPGIDPAGKAAAYASARSTWQVVFLVVGSVVLVIGLGILGFLAYTGAFTSTPAGYHPH